MEHPLARPDSPQDPSPGAPEAEIVVYWRPGCGYCSSLVRQLEQYGVPFRDVDIWSDPEGSEYVRSVARGNETVPTVAVGPVPLVNPSVHDVLSVAVHHVPAAVPAGYEPPQPGRFARWLHDKLSGSNEPV